jgi:hypothetical protein
VIVATYGGRARIGRTLESLAAQTLDRHLFEVIVVCNGPDDGTAAFAAEFGASSHLDLRVLTREEPNFSEALNAGLAEARRDYFALLDDDDWLDPPYLQALLAEAAPDRVVFGQVADVRQSRGSESVTFDNYLNRALCRADRRGAHFDQVSQAAAANGGKLAPTRMGRDCRFEPHLRSGMDTLFWARLFARFDPEVWVLPRAAGAVYRRTLRPGSMSRRRDQAWETDRLCVIRALAEEALERPAARAPLASLAQAQARLLGLYLRENPDRREGVAEALADLPTPLVTMAAVNTSQARLLAVSYAPPGARGVMARSAAATAEYLGEAHEPFNLLLRRPFKTPSADMEPVPDETGYQGATVWRPARPDAMKPGPVLSFASRCLRVVQHRQDSRARYERLYTSPAWLASHMAGAALKARFPRLIWTADLRFPMARRERGRYGVDWPEEGHKALWVADLVEAAVAARGHEPLPRSEGFAAWLGHATMILADDVIAPPVPEGSALPVELSNVGRAIPEAGRPVDFGGADL